MLDVAGLTAAVKAGTVIDSTPSPQYAQGHVPGTINIPIGLLAAWQDGLSMTIVRHI